MPQRPPPRSPLGLPKACCARPQEPVDGEQPWSLNRKGLPNGNKLCGLSRNSLSNGEKLGAPSRKGLAFGGLDVITRLSCGGVGLSVQDVVFL